MKKAIILFLLSVTLVFSYSVSVYALDVTVSGSAQFKCNFLATYMEKHGYVFLETSNKKNIFAAHNADVVVKNDDDKIVGRGKTDPKGQFSIAVPAEERYKIIVSYNGHESEYELTAAQAKNFTAYLGYFDSDEVGRWIDAKLSMR